MSAGCHTPQVPAVGKIAAVGMFDGVHRGHLHLLDDLKAKAALHGLAPLAVTFTSHPLQIIAPAKAPALLTTPQEKEALLRQEGVDVALLPFDEALRATSASDFLRMLHEDYGVERLLLGFNNRFGHDAPRDFESYRALGRREGVAIEQATEFMPEGTAASSSLIRASIADGDLPTATRLLGRPYALTGTVGHGKAIGRTLGFPTANLIPADSRKLIPPTGVYAAIATTADGSRHPAVVNIGRRPTVERHRPDTPQQLQSRTATQTCASTCPPSWSKNSPLTDTASLPPISIEAHLIGFSGDLYGQPLTLSFISCLRPERRFPTLARLREAIAADTARAAALLADIIQQKINP